MAVQITRILTLHMMLIKHNAQIFIMAEEVMQSNIRTLGDEILRKEAKEITEMTPRIQELIDDMFETMYEANGVGLAAPQVGIRKRLVVIDQVMIQSNINPEYGDKWFKQMTEAVLVFRVRLVS